MYHSKHTICYSDENESQLLKTVTSKYNEVKPFLEITMNYKAQPVIQNKKHWSSKTLQGNGNRAPTIKYSYAEP